MNVNGKDYPIYEMENKIHVWNHQPVIIVNDPIVYHTWLEIMVVSYRKHYKSYYSVNDYHRQWSMFHYESLYHTLKTNTPHDESTLRSISLDSAPDKRPTFFGFFICGNGNGETSQVENNSQVAHGTYGGSINDGSPKRLVFFNMENQWKKWMNWVPPS